MENNLVFLDGTRLIEEAGELPVPQDRVSDSLKRLWVGFLLAFHDALG